MGDAPDAPLSRLRVVELEPNVAARFAGKWLTALGAEVFQVLWRPAPDFGGDNDDGLGELLGLSPAEIAQLEDEGVVARKHPRPPGASLRLNVGQSCAAGSSGKS